MIKHLFLTLTLAFCLVAGASAQVPPDKAKRSDDIVTKIRQVDLLNQIVPLLLTKDQINKILPAIERARALVRKTVSNEADVLVKYDAKLDEAIKDALDKGLPPKKEFVVELTRMYKGIAISRQIVAQDNTKDVYETFAKVLNAGQMKVCANSLNASLFDPSMKLDEMKDEAKIKFFVQEIILDPLAYDLLIQLAK